MSEWLFYIFAGIVVGSSVGVLLLKNPVHVALSLVGNLLAVAALFALLDAHFLAVVQITVYAGAVMVLVLFVLMLLNIKEDKGSSFSFYSLAAVGSFIWIGSVFCPFIEKNFVRFPHPADGSVKNFGVLLFERYALLFQLSGFLLLLAMVGAVMLAKKVKR